MAEKCDVCTKEIREGDFCYVLDDFTFMFGRLEEIKSGNGLVISQEGDNRKKLCSKGCFLEKVDRLVEAQIAAHREGF